MTDKHNKQQNVCTSSERTQNKCLYCGSKELLDKVRHNDLGYWFMTYDCGAKRKLSGLTSYDVWTQSKKCKELQSNG